MSYIGPAPNPGQNREVDDISSGFNGNATAFTLQVGGANISPGSSNAIIVSLGGVVQNPGTDYTVAASTLTFTTAPASGLAFFGLVLGQQVDTADANFNDPVITGDLSIADKIVHTGDTNTAIRFPAADTITAETGGSERVRVDSSGNVLIGLSSTLSSNNAKLQVAHTDGNADVIVHRAGNNANPPSLNFQKTRNTSIGNYGTIVQDDDELGSIRWGGADGSNIGYAARIVGAVDGAPGANDMPGRIQFHTSSDGSESLTERMRIDSSGNVGIGTTSVSQKLQVTSGNILLDGTDQFIYLSSDADQWLSANAASNYLRFGTGNAERMRLRATTGGLMINDDGSTRIGEPKLHVLNGGAGNNVASFFFNTTDDRDAILIRHNGATTGTGRKLINFLSDQGNSAGYIICDRTSTSYNTGSDYRLKENEVLISDGITRLKTLKPYRFNFKDNPSKIVDGFFAHEVTAVPEAIAGIKDETEDILYTEEDTIPSGKNIGDIKETIPKYQGIDQSRLVPLLTAALQEAIAKIEVLETKVAALEAA